MSKKMMRHNMITTRISKKRIKKKKSKMIKRKNKKKTIRVGKVIIQVN